MSAKSPREMEDDRLLAERAAEWLQVLKNAGNAERAEFADWLAESPRHAEEFLMTTALDRAIESLPLKENPRLQAMLARASRSVVPLRRQGASGRLPRLRLAAGLAATLVLASALVLQLQTRGERYATAIGEERVVALPDGSQMVLTARTEARVRFSDGARDIELREGEALFKVAKDGRRPFQVHASGAVIRAIGTQFNVLKRPSGTMVSVLEGAVGIATPVEANPATLRAGEEIRIAPDGRIAKRSRAAEITSAAWRQRRLVFRADNLTDIAAEFNRYNRTPRLVFEGDPQSSPRYTGVFDADDPQSLLAFLREDPQITLEKDGERWVVRAR